jgi:hypothetical protein
MFHPMESSSFEVVSVEAVFFFMIIGLGHIIPYNLYLGGRLLLLLFLCKWWASGTLPRIRTKIRTARFASHDCFFLLDGLHLLADAFSGLDR